MDERTELERLVDEVVECTLGVIYENTNDEDEDTHVLEMVIEALQMVLSER